MNRKQIEILESLANHAPLSGFQVAEATGQFRGFVHARLHRLIAANLVRGYWVTNATHEDLKIMLYDLTEEGQRTYLIQLQGYKPCPA